MKGHSAEPSAAAAEREFLHKQFAVYVEAYKQHLDLFIRSIAIYLALVGAIAGYIFRTETTPTTAVALSAFEAVMSVVGITACAVARRFLNQVAHRADRLADQLKVEHFPFAPIRLGTWLVQLMCLAFAVAGVLNARQPMSLDEKPAQAAAEMWDRSRQCAEQSERLVQRSAAAGEKLASDTHPLSWQSHYNRADSKCYARVDSVNGAAKTDTSLPLQIYSIYDVFENRSVATCTDQSTTSASRFCSVSGSPGDCSLCRQFATDKMTR